MMTYNKVFQGTISNDETSQLPAAQFGGKIVVVDSETAVADACATLAAQHIIGFDTETRPSFKAGVTNRVSLLQLSTPDCCFLFRLNRIALSRPILKLLTDKHIIKIGADVAGDIRSLHALRHFTAGGFVDLQSIIADWGVEEKSLRKMSAIVLGHRVSKAQRLSNWEAVKLTEQQQMYAATDAWICIEIYKKLTKTPKVKKQLQKNDSANISAPR